MAQNQSSPCHEGLVNRISFKPRPSRVHFKRDQQANCRADIGFAQGPTIPNCQHARLHVLQKWHKALSDGAECASVKTKAFVHTLAQ